MAKALDAAKKKLKGYRRELAQFQQKQAQTNATMLQLAQQFEKQQVQYEGMEKQSAADINHTKGKARSLLELIAEVENRDFAQVEKEWVEAPIDPAVPSQTKKVPPPLKIEEAPKEEEKDLPVSNPEEARKLLKENLEKKEREEANAPQKKTDKSAVSPVGSK